MILSLAPSMALSAMAANEGPYPQIIINPHNPEVSGGNCYVSTPDDSGIKDTELMADLKTRFWAYQIFQGQIDESDYVSNRLINSLNNVQWGTSITNQEELLAALSDDDTLASGLGITFALMLEAKETYLEAANLTNYAAAYKDEGNWKDGALTIEGRAALEAAFNKSLEKLTIGELFKAALDKNVGAEIKTNGAYTASRVIADFTPASGNTALAQAFYAIVFDRNNYDKGSDRAGGYKYLGEPVATSSWTSGAYGVSGYWTIGEMDSDRTLPDGYYMIRDTYSEKYSPDIGNTGKANAAYMAAVFGYGTVYIKAEAPWVTKTISDSSVELGETVTFTLTGTLPENFYTAYEGYPYIFKDTMAAGITYLGGGAGIDQPLRVYVQVPNDSSWTNRYNNYVVELDGSNGDYAGDGYRLRKSETGAGTEITIIIPDLKNIKGKRVKSDITWETDPDAETIPVNGKSRVVVQYTATLNEDAAIKGYEGNMNTVELHYANNPIWNPAVAVDGGSWAKSWDKAPTGMVNDFVRAYDFGVQLTVYGKKDDGETDNSGNDTDGTEERVPLAGAGFALKKGSGDDVQYAILHKVETPGADEDTNSLAEYTYYLAGWVPEDHLYTYLAGGDTGTRTARSWGAPLETVDIGGFAVPGTGDHYAAVVTQSDGRVRIVGLDNSAYVLEEVITPVGSVTVEDISVRFTTMGYGADGILEGLTATATGSAVESPWQEILAGRAFVGDYATYKELVARFTIYSEPTIEVDTGGMGTALFYIGGVALLAGAALILIFSSAKNKKLEKRDR